jgi:hypothetical protein
LATSGVPVWEELINPLAPAEAKTVAAPITSTLGFLNWIKNGFTRHNAVRVAEGTLGLLLILVAVAELAKGTPAGNLAKKVPFI